MNEYEQKLNEFRETYEAAKSVKIYEKKLSKETRLIPRMEPAIRVENCKDTREVMMQIAFEAAKKGFNCLVDVEFKSSKSRDGSYKMLEWSGVGIPAITKSQS